MRVAESRVIAILIRRRYFRIGSNFQIKKKTTSNKAVFVWNKMLA